MKCSYCKKETAKGIGILYCTKSGERSYFCCSKCFKNFKLGRKPLRVGWIRKKEGKRKEEKK